MVETKKDMGASHTSREISSTAHKLLDSQKIPSLMEFLFIYNLFIYILSWSCKVKWSLYRPGVAQRVGRGISLLFHDRGTRRGEWSTARPGRTLPPGKTRYPFHRRLGGPQSRSGGVENFFATGIRSWTVQPIVSHYTDWATRPTFKLGSKFLWQVKFLRFVWLLACD